MDRCNAFGLSDDCNRCPNVRVQVRASPVIAPPPLTVTLIIISFPSPALSFIPENLPFL